MPFVSTGAFVVAPAAYAEIGMGLKQSHKAGRDTVVHVQMRAQRGIEAFGRDRGAVMPCQHRAQRHQ
ncbi:MAG: hypothetical protein ACI8W7_004483 [Gammaproteobacteria bacterium]|jgi:hypothetical protein